jgi:hypothetical protein
MSREQIGGIIGVTVGSLQVTCSRLGISLRRPRPADSGVGLSQFPRVNIAFRGRTGRPGRPRCSATSDDAQSAVLDHHDDLWRPYKRGAGAIAATGPHSSRIAGDLSRDAGRRVGGRIADTGAAESVTADVQR